MGKRLKDNITLEKIEKYYEITKRAFDIVKKSITKDREKEASEITQMVEAYLSDSLHFKEKKDYINSFGCIYYAHGLERIILNGKGEYHQKDNYSMEVRMVKNGRHRYISVINTYVRNVVNWEEI